MNLLIPHITGGSKMHMAYPFWYMVPVVGVPIKYSASGSLNESADTPYDPVGGPQGPQEAHGKHLFVPGAGAVGQIDMTLG